MARGNGVTSYDRVAVLAVLGLSGVAILWGDKAVSDCGLVRCASRSSEVTRLAGVGMDDWATSLRVVPGSGNEMKRPAEVSAMGIEEAE